MTEGTIGAGEAIRSGVTRRRNRGEDRRGTPRVVSGGGAASLSNSRGLSYEQTSAPTHASARRPWNAATSLSVTNAVAASTISVTHPCDAAAPCARLGTMVFDFQSSIADWRYGLKREESQSVRAQTEPLSGLNASWPSLEPTRRSQHVTASGLGAPCGRPNVSERASYMPSGPGVGAHPHPL